MSLKLTRKQQRLFDEYILEQQQHFIEDGWPIRFDFVYEELLHALLGGSPQEQFLRAMHEKLNVVLVKRGRDQELLLMREKDLDAVMYPPRSEKVPIVVQVQRQQPPPRRKRRNKRKALK